MIDFISKELSEVLGSNFGHIEVEVFKNEFKSRSFKTTSQRSKDIKEYAVLLNFYSPRAHKFVRKTPHLPHPATHQSWTGKVVCEAGFFQTQ